MLIQSNKVVTEHWELIEPERAWNGRWVCVPTVHPIGDRRVLRCAQSALDAGFGVHFIWLGGTPGRTQHSPRIRETRLAAAGSFKDRARVLPRLYRLAQASRPDAWHIHDFYLLPFALFWHWRHGGRTVYDVHEYYPVYYSAKLPLPQALRAWTAAALSRFETSVARTVGGANVVSEQMLQTFSQAGVATSVTPNYPSIQMFRDAPTALWAERVRQVVHTGTLTAEYGSTVLVDMARSLLRTHPQLKIVAIERFPSEAARGEFLEHIERSGGPLPNLVLVPPLPVHEVPRLLGQSGIGLSLIQPGGQYDRAVPGKLYEYAIAGLYVVGPDLPGHRAVVPQHACGRLVDPALAEGYADAVRDAVARADALREPVASAAAAAAQALTWEAASSPQLQRLLGQVLG